MEYNLHPWYCNSFLSISSPRGEFKQAGYRVHGFTIFTPFFFSSRLGGMRRLPDISGHDQQCESTYWDSIPPGHMPNVWIKQVKWLSYKPELYIVCKMFASDGMPRTTVGWSLKPYEKSLSTWSSRKAEKQCSSLSTLLVMWAFSLELSQ